MVRGSLLVTLAFVVATAAGCSKYETPVDKFHGTSYEVAKQSQIYNPRAGIADGYSVGLDGSVATKVAERYEQGYTIPATKTETYSISSGGVTIK